MFGVICSLIVPRYCNPSTLLHSDIWHYAVFALGNVITENQSIGTGESGSEK